MENNFPLREDSSVKTQDELNEGLSNYSKNIIMPASMERLIEERASIVRRITAYRLGDYREELKPKLRLIDKRIYELNSTNATEI